MKTSTVPIDKAGPGDTLKVSINGGSVTLTPNKKTVDLVRNGQALVFSTAGEKTLSLEAANRILEETRDEHRDQSFAGIGRSKRGR